MIDQQFELDLTAYLDGTLPDEQRSAVEVRLQSDPEARALADQYRKLDALLARTMPLPAVDLDGLGRQVMARIDEQAAERPAIAGRIWRHAAPLAAAAAVAVALGLAALLYLAPGREPSPQIAQVDGPNRQVALVTGPAAESSARATVAAVSIGPAEQSADDWRIAEAIIARPARVTLIAAGPGAAHDSPLSPF